MDNIVSGWGFDNTGNCWTTCCTFATNTRLYINDTLILRSIYLHTQWNNYKLMFIDIPLLTYQIYFTMWIPRMKQDTVEFMSHSLLLQGIYSQAFLGLDLSHQDGDSQVCSILKIKRNILTSLCISSQLTIHLTPCIKRTLGLMFHYKLTVKWHLLCELNVSVSFGILNNYITLLNKQENQHNHLWAWD